MPGAGSDYAIIRPMRLYNSLTQSLSEFHPQDNQVTLYVCGITPYDTTHLGHAATYCAFDVLVRYLEFRGVRVRYTENVTDIDDDTIREAKKRGTTWDALGNRWTAHFIEDMVVLNVRPPDFYPRATDVIPEIQEIVQGLIARGLAYPANGSVYFHVASDLNFGKLSHIPTRAEMLEVANERGNFPDDPNKRDPLDFVLWQATRPGEPAWDSPWGPGRPGWHIECSSMVRKFLGDEIDIHGGGADLIFPHHECEIAQSTNYTGCDRLARVWMHTGMVRYQGEKMSKSLGNLVMARDLLKEFPANSLRLYLAKHHYRAPWEHTETEMRESLTQCKDFRIAARQTGGTRGYLDPTPFREQFLHALDDDLDTPAAVDTLCRLASEIMTGEYDEMDVRDAAHQLRDLSAILGLNLPSGEPEARVRQGWSEHLKRFPVESSPSR